MTAFHPLTKCASLKPGQMKRFIVDNKPVLLANCDGEYLAIADKCSHEDAALSRGALRGCSVECPLHGSHFNLRTGQPMEEPATEPVETYETEIRDDTIYIKMT